MIVRIWSSMVAAGRDADFLAYASGRSRAMFLSQPGCLGVLVLRNQDGTHATCSFWRDRQSAEALEASPAYRETLAGLIATGVLAGRATVARYDVSCGGAHGSALLEAIGALP